MKTIHIILLVDLPYFNIFETLYYEAKKDPRFKITVGMIKSHDERCNTNQVDNVLKQHGIEYEMFFNETTGVEFDVKHLQPDLVFLQTPYDWDKIRHKYYSSHYLMQFTKVAYISYGGSIISYEHPPLKDMIKNNSFFKRAWSSFVENKLIAAQLNQYHPNQFKACGYMKLDKFLHYKSNPDFKFKQRDNFNKIIAYKPHWHVSQKGESNFFRDIEVLLKLIQSRQDVQLLFIEHPMLKHSIITNKCLTQEELSKLWNVLENTPNIKIINEDDFLDDIANADIFVGDYCSTIIEAAILGVRIIYTPLNETLSEFGKEFSKYVLTASTSEQLQEFLQTSLQNNEKTDTAFIKVASNSNLFTFWQKICRRKTSYAKELLDYIYLKLHKG